MVGWTRVQSSLPLNYQSSALVQAPQELLHIMQKFVQLQQSQVCSPLNVIQSRHV